MGIEVGQIVQLVIRETEQVVDESKITVLQGESSGVSIPAIVTSIDSETQTAHLEIAYADDKTATIPDVALEAIADARTEEPG